MEGAADNHAPSASVAIVLAGYRPNVEFFRQQLESIRQQEFRDWQCVISMDSPIDELRSEASLASYFSDGRFLWFENAQRLGFKHNFVEGARRALALGVKYIAFSDQDDVWYPAKLRDLVESVSTSSMSLAHSDMDLLINGTIVTRSVWSLEHRAVWHNTPASFLIRNVASGAAILACADLVRKYTEIPASFAYHDWWFAFVASCHGGLQALHRPLYAYRQHAGNVVGVPHIGGPNREPWWDLPSRCRDLVAFRQEVMARVQTAQELGLLLPDFERRMFAEQSFGGLDYLRYGFRVLKDPGTAIKVLGLFVARLLARIGVRATSSAESRRLALSAPTSVNAEHP